MGVTLLVVFIGTVGFHVASIVRSDLIQPWIVAVTLLVTSILAFLLASSFRAAQPFIKVCGIVLLVSALTTGIGHWLPQVRGGYPPPHEDQERLDDSSMSMQRRADLGETIIFGGIGESTVQGAIGKGQCPLCHGFRQGWGSHRAPNLWGITARKRLHATSLDYIAESHVCPSCYVVGGFGVKGTENRESPMPRIHRPPISLTIDELVAVDTWLFFREGEVPPAPEDIAEAYKKLIPENQRPGLLKDKIESQSFRVRLTGEEAIETIFAESSCLQCHTIPGISPGGSSTYKAPHLAMKTRFSELINDPSYDGQSITVQDYVREAILDFSRHRIPGHPNHKMPQDFSHTISALAVDKMVDFLSTLEIDKGFDPGLRDNPNS